MAKPAAATQTPNGHQAGTATPSKPRAGASTGKASARRRKNTFRARIRMYRQGLGDCFLITLPKSGSPDDFRILIDCGVILGTPDAVTKMTEVLKDVVAVSKGRIDLLLGTHQHWDHLSGFIQAAGVFDQLEVKKVWMAWTENPDDDLAKQLAGDRDAALEALRAAGSRMLMSGDLDGAGEVAEFAALFGAAGGASTQDAIERLRRKAKAPVRYCYPADAPIHLDDPDARLYVLGPPHDPKLIRQTLDTKRDPETYGIGAQMAAVAAALETLKTEPASPFGTLHAIPMNVAAGLPFFKKHYLGASRSGDEWRRIDSDWLDGSSELALALDRATNNTSLVLAIELRDGDVLLFAADAQVGNWLSWQDLKWTVGGRDVTGPELLRRTVFYKVGHHGSHNATLRQKGLEQMERLATAVIPVNHEMALKKRWGNMPLPELVDALRDRAAKGVLRSDEDPKDPIQGVEVNPLYFEITL